jgi:hypothetical protein
MITARYWREIPQRYRLEAGKCTKCGKIHFPPRLICANCRNREFETVKLSDEGKVLTYTIIHTPPTEFSDESPYAIGIVEMDNGAKVMAQIADISFDDMEIGKRVKIEFRRIAKEGHDGVLFYGYKFVPA